MSLIERLSGSAVGNQTGSHALPRTVDAFTESVSPSVLSRGGGGRSATSGGPGSFSAGLFAGIPPLTSVSSQTGRCVSLD